MVKINDKTYFIVARLISIVCLIGAMGLSASLAQAAPSALPPRPTPPDLPALPPRPVPGPHSTSSRAPTGGYIELDVQLGQSWAVGDVPWQALWTVVQWQDRAGEWHDVVGWQGSLDEANSAECKKVWWVAREDLDKGPFRWVVYRRGGGESLAQSESFDLPYQVGETTCVGVMLDRQLCGAPSGVLNLMLAGGFIPGSDGQVTLDSSFGFSQALADGSDLRVTAADEETPIPFWIEERDMAWLDPATCLPGRQILQMPAT